jgi:hypothetical protein
MRNTSLIFTNYGGKRRTSHLNLFSYSFLNLILLILVDEPTKYLDLPKPFAPLEEFFTDHPQNTLCAMTVISWIKEWLNIWHLMEYLV